MLKSSADEGGQLELFVRFLSDIELMTLTKTLNIINLAD